MNGLRRIWRMVRSHHMSRLLALSVLVGLVAGLGALAFNFVLDLANHLFLAGTTGFVAPQPGGEGGTEIGRAHV